MPYYVVSDPAKYMHKIDRSALYMGSAGSNDYYVKDSCIKVICYIDTLLDAEYSCDESSDILHQATDLEKRKARDRSRLSYLQIAKWKCSWNPSRTIWALILQAEDNSNVAQIGDDIAYDWARCAVRIV